MDPITTRSHHAVSRHVSRPGCPCEMTPFYQVSEHPKVERTALINQYTTMRLVHMAKNQTIKNSLSLKPIHDFLATESLPLFQSGSSNTLLSLITFDCLIEKTSGEQIRDHISFNLKIPKANSKEETVFSYDMIEKPYGGKSNLYQAIKHFYHVGRSLANPHNKKHGHVPDYDPKSSKHDQYIRHTEQFLVAYLALPEAAQMLYEHLFGAIRAKYSGAKTAKVYNMGLHMHSTKTCCAPCEYTLLGLMNKRKEFVLDRKSLGFLPNFIKICTLSNSTLQIKVPQKSPFRLIVTTSVTQSDAHHQKQPTYLCKPLKSDEQIPFHDLHVKSHKVSQRIFTTMVNSSYDSRRLPPYPSLSDITVGISGSKISPGSEKTKKKARETRQKELDVPKDLRLLLESMKIEDKV